jgi:hypothetical protein
MTKVLVYITVIFALIAIPISTIYWWPRFWGSQSEHWYPWIPWLKIALAVIAGLWLLRLILWVRERRVGGKFYGGISMYEGTALHSTSDEPSSEADWIVDEHGPPRRPHGKPQGEPESYPVPESLDDDILSRMGEARREIKKVAKDLTDASQVRKRLRF